MHKRVLLYSLNFEPQYTGNLKLHLHVTPHLVRIAYPYCSKAQYGSAISTANSINRKNHTSQTASLRVVSLDKIHVQWLIERQTLLPMLATKKINQNLLQSTKI
jgi:hypothetical protein